MGIFSSLTGSKSARRQATAAREAAQIQAASQREAIAAQERAQGKALEAQEKGFGRAEGFLSPLLGDGTALSRLRALSGASGEDSQREAFGSLQTRPDQEFLREEGLRGIENITAGSGGLGGGNFGRDLTRFSSGLALQNLQNELNQLGNLANFDSGIRQGLGNLATGQGAAAAQIQSNIGNAQASGLQNIGAINARGIQQNAAFKGQANQFLGQAADSGAQAGLQALGFI